MSGIERSRWDAAIVAEQKCHKTDALSTSDQEREKLVTQRSCYP